MRLIGVDWLREKSVFMIVSALLGTGMILFLVIPIVGSFTGSATSIPEALTDARTTGAILTSFYCAFLATLFIFVLGVPFAYVFTRREFPGKRFLDSLIDIPILIPHNAAGIALLMVLGPASSIGTASEALGFRFVDSILGIVVAMAFVSAPFMIRSAQESFLSISPNMERAAKSLGASDARVFVHVTFPLAARGILTGCLLTWARAISEFGAVVMLAYNPKTAPVQLYDVFISEGLRAALPINGLLMVLAFVILIVFRVVVAKPTRPVH
jgi:molybdate/tungstate transport system permease protein